MNQEKLTQQVNDGKSIQDLATIYNKSKTSIRHWLKKYELITTGKAGNKSIVITDDCKTCVKCNTLKPLSNFYYRSDRNTPHSYCSSCMKEDVTERSHLSKKFYVDALGNKCSRCNQSYDYKSYDFHHIEPEHKDFTLRDHKLATHTKIIQELSKCVLVCTNCHGEIHKELKFQNGYINKIIGNSERWVYQKERKLLITGKSSCECCGYNSWEGNLVIVFKKNDKIYKKYNKTNFTDDFIRALKDSSVVCRNCMRLA